MTLSVVILAAGSGKRMLSTVPKVLHSLGGLPLLSHVVKTAQSLQPESIFVVYGNGGSKVKETLHDLDVTWVEQTEQKGTGHALLQALPHIPDANQVLVLYGDVPLITHHTLQTLLRTTHDSQLGLLVAKVDNPNGFGRIIKNAESEIIAIVEHRDATQDQLKINEINTGIMTASAALFKKWLPLIKNTNAQNEYYLTDVISLAVRDGYTVTSILATCNKEVSGVNDRKELMALERHYQYQKACDFLLQGVSIIDPNRFDCRGNVIINQDVMIDINVILEGDVYIAEGSKIGPNAIIKNTRIGRNVIIQSHSVIEDAIIGDDCVIGPFARIRPNTILKSNVHVGNFVELKNTQIAEESKVNHLTYLGDAIVGKKVNVGACTITCNYDGVNKYQTTIQDGAFIGSGTELVAPITIGEEAYIGAGSTITRNAPEKQLTIGRAKQVTVKGWKKCPKS